MTVFTKDEEHVLRTEKWNQELKLRRKTTSDLRPTRLDRDREERRRVSEKWGAARQHVFDIIAARGHVIARNHVTACNHVIAHSHEVLQPEGKSGWLEFDAAEVELSQTPVDSLLPEHDPEEIDLEVCDVSRDLSRALLWGGAGVEELEWEEKEDEKEEEERLLESGSEAQDHVMELSPGDPELVYICLSFVLYLLISLC